LRNKRKEVNWWKITTSEDLTQSIIISEKKIDNKDNVGIAELTEADAQLLENTWHPSKEIEVLGKDGNEKVMTVPVNINSFSKNIEQIKNNIGKLK
jgi:23S rRNA A2030 N6-methylase RlmJ